MAVVDVETYSASTINHASKAAGVQGLFINKTVSVTSGDSATSVYRIAQIPSNYIPFIGSIATAGVSGLTDVDFGLHYTGADGGAVIDADGFVDGVDLSGAVTIAAPSALFTAISAANFDKTLAVLNSKLSSENQTYDFTMTINAAATGAGTISVRALFINGA